MLYVAEQQKIIGRAAKSKAIAPQNVNPFIKLLNQQDPKEAKDILDSFSRKLLLPVRDVPEQYLVVNWGNLNYVPVIRNFGSWDLATGGGLKGTFANGGDLKVNIRNGVISHGGRQFELAALDIVGRQNGKLERQHTLWGGRKQEYFAVSNSIDGSFYPMDEASYHSLMVQMLIAEPVTFEPYFTLVIDRAPYIRVYRLNLNRI
jgi:dolichyl-diphosphooligosaccharide--protein glycosyltransferase